MTDENNEEATRVLPRVGVIIRGDGCPNFRLSLDSVLSQECEAEVVVVAVCDGDAASFYDCLDATNVGVTHSLFGRLLRRRYGEAASYNLGLDTCRDCDMFALVSPGEIWHKDHISSLLGFLSDRPGEIAVYAPSKFNITSLSGEVLTKKRSRGPVGSYIFSLGGSDAFLFGKSGARQDLALRLIRSGVPLVETKGRTWAILDGLDGVSEGFDPLDPNLHDVSVSARERPAFTPDVVDEF